MVRLEERPWQGRSTMLLDLRAAAHLTGMAVPHGDDPREYDSLEWSISAAASIGTHLLVAGRQVTLIDDHDERRQIDNPAQLGEYLAEVSPSKLPDLSRVAEVVRTAARDSAVVAIVATLDSTSLRTLAEAHPRGSAIPAFAMLLDVDSWRTDTEPSTTSASCNAAARVLENAGWQVVVVHAGESIADIWLTLLRSGRGVRAEVGGVALR
jgi:hypothetical protein